MLYAGVKLILTAVIIVAISEVSKRVSWVGGLLAALPIVSFLAMIWLYIDTRDKHQVAALSWDIAWLIIPTLPFFLLLPFLLKKLSFVSAFSLATVVMLILYVVMVYFLKKYDVIS